MTSPNIYIGCTGFNYDSWKASKGNFYPTTINEKDFLAFYSTKFPTTEINSTYYKIPNIKTTKRWASLLPKGFVLTAKIPREISRSPFLSQVDELLDKFLKVMAPLDEVLGPLVMQLSPDFTFSQRNIEELESFLDLFPLEKYSLAVELRDIQWFQEDLFSMINSYQNVGLVSSFLHYLPFQIFSEVNNNFHYLRIIGSHDLDISSGKEIIDRSSTISHLSELIKQSVSNNPISTFYIYINNHFSGYAPLASKKLVEELNKNNLMPISPFSSTFKGQKDLSHYF